MEPREKHCCPVCGLCYPTQEIADACKAWCDEHGTCNIEITKHALPPNV